MKKKFLLRALLGAPIGAFISSIIAIFISLAEGNGEYLPVAQELATLCGSETNAVILQTICALFIGAVYAGASVIWEIEEWSLLKQTIVHFLVTVVPLFGVGYIINWMPHEIFGALGYAGVFVGIYVTIWFTAYFSIKAKIDEMNNKLEKTQGEK